MYNIFIGIPFSSILPVLCYLQDSIESLHSRIENTGAVTLSTVELLFYAYICFVLTCKLCACVTAGANMSTYTCHHSAVCVELCTKLERCVNLSVCSHLKVTNQQIFTREWWLYMVICLCEDYYVLYSFQIQTLEQMQTMLTGFLCALVLPRKCLYCHASQTLFSSFLTKSTIQCYRTYIIEKGPLNKISQTREAVL